MTPTTPSHFNVQHSGQFQFLDGATGAISFPGTFRRPPSHPK